MPIDYKDYPPNWKSELRPAVLTRANNACESCQVKNYDVVRWNAEEGYYESFDEYLPETYAEARTLWVDLMASHWKNDWKVIVLTIAHLDHDTENNALENLKALCQRCHLNYDRGDNTRRRRYGKNFEKNQLKIELHFPTDYD